MKFPLVLLVALTSPLAADAALTITSSYESFASTTGVTPSGWTQVGSGTADDYVTSGNLTVPGLATSGGNKWSLNGGANNLYRYTFASAAPTAGETVYYSFILQINNLGSLTTSGATTPAFLLNTNSATANSGGVASIGIRKDAVDGTKFNLSLDGGMRGPSGSGVINSTTQYSTGTSLFIVASYTVGTGVNLWINPSSSDFGAMTAPTATLTDTAGTASVTSFYTMTSSAASGQPSNWNIDELRFGSTWADVTPSSVPEPSSYALLAGGFGIMLAICRRKR